MRRGFILVEASITYIILSFALVAFLPMLILSLKTNTHMEQLKVATTLSWELLEEIQLRRWDETTPSPTQKTDTPSALGVDGTETDTDKRSFNDTDDFDGWAEKPPLDPVMRPLLDFFTYTRTVTVQYVNADLSATAIPTDYKHITVCTSKPDMKPVCLDTIVTNR